MEAIILENKPKLIRWLSSDYLIVLQHVQAKKLITMSQYYDLKEMKVKDSVITLLDIILGRGANMCRDFLNLLKDDDVNEISPELREWIKTVDTEDQKTENDKGRESLNRPLQETANMAGIQGTCQKPDGDCEHRSIQDYQKFLKENLSRLVQKVKNIDPIIDDLDLHEELVANVRAKSTGQEKMRELLTFVNSESIAKDLFNSLREHEKHLMNELLKRY